MADITMCRGENCPLKETCYRFTAIANEFRQSYFKDIPYNYEKVWCNEYWDNEEYKKEKGRK